MASARLAPKEINPTLTGERVILVPYLREHVPQYNKWMQNPSLQELTASEPLTLEQEYEMQKSWAEDHSKCTFIILDRSLPDTPGTTTTGGGMVGDVNLFFRDDIDGAEIEIMIAEESSRRKGLAQEALQMMMGFGTERYGVKRFVAKILDKAHASLKLFREKLEYKDYEFLEDFNTHVLEYTLPGYQRCAPEKEEESKSAQTEAKSEAEEDYLAGALKKLNLADFAYQLNAKQSKQVQDMCLALLQQKLSVKSKKFQIQKDNFKKQLDQMSQQGISSGDKWDKAQKQVAFFDSKLQSVMASHESELDALRAKLLADERLRAVHSQ